MKEQTLPSVKVAEKALRDVGFSRRQAKAILSEGFKSLRDVDIEAELPGDTPVIENKTEWLLKRAANILKGL